MLTPQHLDEITAQRMTDRHRHAGEHRRAGRARTPGRVQALALAACAAVLQRMGSWLHARGGSFARRAGAAARAADGRPAGL